MSWESPRFWNLIVRWPSWPAEGKGDGKGANRSGTNGALDRQNDRRNSALPKAAGIAPQARWDEMGWDGMRCFNHAMNLIKSHLTQNFSRCFKMF